MFHEDPSSLTIWGFQMKQPKCVWSWRPGPIPQHSTQIQLLLWEILMDVTEKGGREPGGVGGWKGDQGRARNKCSSHTVLACKAYVARWAKCIFSFWSFRPSTGSSIAPHSWFVPPVTVVWISSRGNYCPWKFWAVYPFACHFHDVLSSSFGKRLSWNFP